MFTLAWLFSSCSAAEETVPDYLLHFAILENMAIETVKLSDVLALRKINQQRADFIGRFWRARAWTANLAFIQTLTAEYKQRSLGATDEEKRSAENDFREEIKLTLISYYYDHAQDIARMITYSTDRAKADPNAK